MRLNDWRMRSVAEVLTPKQHSAVERARANPDLRRILFRKATGIKWYDAFAAAGFIAPSEIPRPVPAKEEGYVVIPHWLITDYLVSASSEFSKPENRDYAIKFLEFMRATTGYARDRKFSNYRVWWQLSKAVQHIPIDLLSDGDIQIFSYWIEDPYQRGVIAETLGHHWLSAVLDHVDPHARMLAKTFLPVLYRVSIRGQSSEDSARKEVALSFDAWYGKKITKAIAAKCGRVLGVVAAEILKGRIEEMIIGLDSDRWSTIRRPAIEDHEQNRRANEAEDVLVEAFRDCLVSFVEYDPAVATPYVSAMLNDKFWLIRRIAVHAIDARFVDLESLVGNVLDASYFNSYLQHELWQLLNHHYAAFSQENKHRVLAAIESLTQIDGSHNEHAGATAYVRAKWLAAIRDCDEHAATLYRNYVQVAGGEPEHPDFSSYMSSGLVASEPPIPVAQLRAMEVPVLVNQLKAYRDPGKFMEPGIEGLAKALRETVKSEPLRYYKDLELFAGLDLAYVYPVIEAYSELWGEKTQLVWEEIWPRLLAFCEGLVGQPRFWADEGPRERPHFVANRHWVVGGIARLIEHGTRSDEHAFSAELLPQTERILNVLLDHEVGAEFEFNSDAVSIAINSPRGRCLEALINLTLRSCRLAQNDAERARVWARFERRYESELGRVLQREYEFATLVVNYLPNFLYMSKGWVLQNLDAIFNGREEQQWLCAMQAYAYVDTVYPEIYKHLKDGGHFIRALDDERLKDRVDEKIVQNIAIAYLVGAESLDDENGLLYLLLQRRRFAELSQLVWFFWAMRNDGEDEEVRRKVFALWACILSAIDFTTRDGRRLASRLCDWTVFVKEVDQTNKALITSVAPFAEEDYHSSVLLESIARISERQPSEAHEIWMSMLESAQPSFPIEAVRKALVNILREGREGRRKAKAIVSRYIAAADDEVVAIWKALGAESAG